MRRVPGRARWRTRVPAFTAGQWPGVPFAPLPSFLLLLGVWNGLLVLGPRCPRLAFAAAAAVLLLARPPGAPAAFRGRSATARSGELAAGLLVGLALFAPGLVAIAGLGSWLGLAPEPAVGIGSGTVFFTGASSPVFEELLYRERIALSLSPRLGLAPASLVAALLFAGSHLEAWAVLGAFVVGVVLAVVYACTRSVGLCVAIHAGLNLAALRG